ncbi:MAG: DegT/DnrJ/EryC1/StrS family aminotransferase [Pseudomonadota bacterium]
MPLQPFTGSFTQQEPIAEEAIAAAVDVMRSGRLHRYNVAGEELPPASVLEKAFADYQGARFCLACASGGYAMQLSLRAADLQAGEPILTNAFTLAPVPGAIAAVGGKPVLVESSADLTIDLQDLWEKAKASNARFLMLSHMRGHICDMDRLADILDQTGLTLIEDCAHTMGARWRGRMSGSFGLAGCFSTQTYKHINSGEGGLITSDDPLFMARAILLSGSYMLYERHGAAPERSVFDGLRLETPNCSGRMDNLRAAILVKQIEALDGSVARWNERYRMLEAGLDQSVVMQVPKRPSEEDFVGSSIQFLIAGITATEATRFLADAKSLGVEVKWFGAADPVAFTSNHHSWAYLEDQDLPKTDAVLSGLFDLRIPLTFSVEDCRHIAEILVSCADRLYQRGVA